MTPPECHQGAEQGSLVYKLDYLETPKESWTSPSSRPGEDHEWPHHADLLQELAGSGVIESKIRLALMIDTGTPQMDYLILLAIAGTG